MHHRYDSAPITPVVILYKSANRPRDATARVVHELADRLRAAGCDTVVLGMDNRTHPHRFRPSRGGFNARVKYAFGKVRDQVAEGRFLVRTVRALHQQPDRSQVVISVDYPTGIGLAPVVARWLGRKRLHAISWVMDDYQDQKLVRSPWALEARFRRFLDRQAIRRADTVVTIGQCMADRIARHTGRDAIVIPVWAPSPAAETDPGAVAEIRDSWGAQPDTTVVLYSGHAAPHHPLEPLVAVAEAMVDEPGVKFVVSGVGVELERWRRSPRPAALGNWRFGEQVPQEQVDALLAAGDVHVVSLAENVTGTCVPSKTYAALVRGRPVLYLGSPDGQAGRDVLASGGGVVVSTADPAAACGAVRTLADPATRARMGQAGRAWAEQHCVLDVVVGAWIDLVRRALLARQIPEDVGIAIKRTEA